LNFGAKKEHVGGVTCHLSKSHSSCHGASTWNLGEQALKLLDPSSIMRSSQAQIKAQFPFWSKLLSKAQFSLRPNTWPKENPILLDPKYKAQNKILI